LVDVAGEHRIDRPFRLELVSESLDQLDVIPAAGLDPLTRDRQHVRAGVQADDPPLLSHGRREQW
jgi:hypothetical protein